MENKINIAEILKDCPQGMALDSTMWDNLYFDRVDNDLIHCYYELDGHRNTTMFCKNGCYTAHKLSKCVIFPKGKTTWEGFVPPCKFKDGDVIYVKSKSILNTELIGIYKKEDNERIYDYCSVSLSRESFYHHNVYGLIHKSIIYISRLATEEEKEKLFQAIKDNGYHWNEETKTLEKLLEFKDGDIVTTEIGSIFIYNESLNNQDYFGCYVGLSCVNIKSKNPKIVIMDQFSFKNSNLRIATDAEKVILFQAIKDNGYYWNVETKNLDKLVEPKFKVGDRVRNKNYKDYIYTIHDIVDKGYIAKEIDADYPIIILFGSQEDNYELVPNKFDITTLKPFESKVLVRNCDSSYWRPAIFGFTEKDKNDPFYVVGGNFFNKCIPYEGNEHLLGTTNDCDEYYKI